MKEQHITFKISKTKSGQMLINMSFYPPPSKTKEEFEALPMYRREMQTCAADIGKYVMERLAQAEAQKK